MCANGFLHISYQYLRETVMESKGKPFTCYRNKLMLATCTPEKEADKESIQWLSTFPEE